MDRQVNKENGSSPAEGGASPPRSPSQQPPEAPTPDVPIVEGPPRVLDLDEFVEPPLPPLPVPTPPPPDMHLFRAPLDFELDDLLGVRAPEEPLTEPLFGERPIGPIQQMAEMMNLEHYLQEPDAMETGLGLSGPALYRFHGLNPLAAAFLPLRRNSMLVARRARSRRLTLAEFVLGQQLGNARAVDGLPPTARRLNFEAEAFRLLNGNQSRVSAGPGAANASANAARDAARLQVNVVRPRISLPIVHPLVIEEVNEDDDDEEEEEEEEDDDDDVPVENVGQGEIHDGQLPQPHEEQGDDREIVDEEL